MENAIVLIEEPPTSLMRSENMEKLNKMLVKMNLEDRERAISVVREAVVKEFPTMVNPELYATTVSPIDKKQDFSLSNVGELNKETGVMSPGGFSARYLDAVDKNATVNHWRRYWDMVNEAERDEIEFPLFNYHYPYIHWYAFHYLPMDRSLPYLKYLRGKLLIDATELPEMLVTNVDARLKETIDKFKEIISE